MDSINIRGIACEALLGVKQRERKKRQSILVDLSVHLDLEPAANTDQLDLTVDYHVLTERVQKLVRDHECFLVETLAEKICRSVLTDARIRQMTVRIYKFPTSLRDEIEHVMVELTR